MPLPLIPLIIGGAAAAAGAAGVGAGIHGAVKMKDAKDTMESANRRHQQNISRFEEKNESTTTAMDRLGKLELEILTGFDKFIEVFEKIHNKPAFETIFKEGIQLPKYNKEELRNVSVGAGVLLGGLGGAAAGTAGGFAAAGATSAAVMALGTASTGTAIASLSGVAATNATLAALGGGALAAGGGGMALGSAILGGATLGVGLLVGGIIFNVTGKKLSEKADEAWYQMKRAEEEIDLICAYLVELGGAAIEYYASLSDVNDLYEDNFGVLDNMVNRLDRTDYDTFSEKERLVLENTVLLVTLLYEMCKVKLVLQSEGDGMNRINYVDIDEMQSKVVAVQEKIHS